MKAHCDLFCSLSDISPLQPTSGTL